MRALSEEEYEIKEAGYDTPCWLWMRALNGGGYGVAWDGRNVPAHKLMYQRSGKDIPDGFQLDHLCRNRRCVNPDHLEAVTQAVNIRRGRLAFRMDEVKASEIRRRKALGERSVDLAKEFGTVRTYIDDIVRGKAWKS